MKTSPVVVICATVVLVVAISAVALLAATEASTDSIALLIGLLTMLVTNVVTLARQEKTLTATEKVEETVYDLSNGKMDAKIRAGVADVLAEHLIDPTTREQLKADRERRGEH